MCKSFMPTLYELYREERGNMTTPPFQARGLASRRISIWREAFPDRIDDNRLARFMLAKNATGARLNRLIPAWAKTPPPPKPQKPWAGQPPRFPAWVQTMNPDALHFHRSN